MNDWHVGVITPEIPDVHKKFLTFSTSKQKYIANPFSTYWLTLRQLQERKKKHMEQSEY